MTLGDLKALVRGNIARTDKDDLIPTWINKGLRRIARDHDWRALDTWVELQTTAGQDFVTLPSNLRLLWLVRADARLIEELHPVELEQLQPDRTVVLRGRPVAYAQSGTTLRIYPAPDRTYTVQLFYSRWPAPLVSNTDEPEIPGIDDALEGAATHEAYMHMQLYEDAREWFARYRGALAEAVAVDARRPAWVPGRVGRFLPTPTFSPDPALDPLVKRVV